MNFTNFWLIKAREKQILKIVDWCQKQKVKAETLTNKEILEAIYSQVRNTY